MATREEPRFDHLAARIGSASRVTVLTGAGVSAASGVPTFRGPGGLWRQHRAEDLATHAAFARDPHLVWDWYAWRREVVAGCRPNRGHEVLADWSRRRPGFTVVTQNVDGLHERAGTRTLVRLHGSLWRLRCWEDCRAGEWSDERVPLAPLPPRCPTCGGLARPAVVWFGEPLDPRQWRDAAAATDCDVFLIVGTSAVVQPAASLAPLARARGAFVVEINPDATPATGDAHVSVRAPAERALDALDRVVHGIRP